jgi:hypothetical protein
MKIASSWALAIMLLSASFVTQSAEFSDQRVFTREDQRQRLDQARENMRAGDRETADSGNEPLVRKPPPKVPEVHLQGFIRRSDGPPAVWLNDRSTLRGDRIDGNLTVESGRISGQTVLIRLPDGRRIRLKPGQRYEPESGQVTDALHQ